MLFTQTGGWIINHETGRYTWFPREHEVYVPQSWVNESQDVKWVRWPDEPFPGPECSSFSDSERHVEPAVCKTLFEDS